MNKHIFIAVCNLLIVMQLFAQDNIIDEVIWVVGDEAILRSEVEEERLRAQYEGQQIAGDPYCVIPEQIAIQKLFLHQAELDSIEVNESTVASQVNMRLNYYISQIGSKEKMEEYFRKSMSEMKEEMMTSVRNQMIIQQMQQKLTENIKSTPAEIRRYYNGLPADSIPTMPAEVEVQIISFEPPVPQAEIDRIKQTLRDFTERINSGNSDFAMLARLYSEDTESAKRGGELGFVGRGQLVPEFADVAFNLSNTQKVSRIVETEYGFHIIQLIEKRGERINCRHILLRPRLSATDKTNAITRLDSIANLVRAEKLTFEQAVAYFSQDKNTAMNAGLMMNQNTGATKFEYQDLPPEIARQIYTMNIGEISKPFVMMDEAKNKEVCAIVKLKSKTDVHKANLVDDYQTIRQMYEQKLSEELLHKWILNKQKETYVSIDPEWRGCDFEYPGWVKE
ncbi:MAG: peptidylprolyl isomerase [Paludibacter sp.]|nr:peptidylprolyl isomerase [Bacteroidales bacterium]MCM1068651.1 peptidylprolyl isomerase [Prevotella sp.]MCM1353315.1 peptidylprolyl isomerase [Bacteroides sp.]MCM1442277.1 peptidylprolyl isomerase [Muribaculum sp.]MCM1481096.1 peptidylprolyl isomerase [Paludibacter sp.]